MISSANQSVGLFGRLEKLISRCLLLLALIAFLLAGMIFRMATKATVSSNVFMLPLTLSKTLPVEDLKSPMDAATISEPIVERIMLRKTFPEAWIWEGLNEER